MSNLVLTRKKHESVIIHLDDDIICEVTVTALGMTEGSYISYLIF